MDSFLNCTIVDTETIDCNGTSYILKEQNLTINDKMFWVYLAIYVGLVLTAGLMSGLTMGLLSLDMMTLKVMKDGGTSSEKKYANKIIPIVKRHHLLLVTLLLGNAAAVESMPIFLDKISDPVTAILVSVTAVLIFGEVIPQAVCTRFGLAIGATLAPFVYVLMAMFFIVAWPLSKLLDCLLGKDHLTLYRRPQLKVLVDIHGEPTDHDGNEEQLSHDEVLIIKGALDMKNKTVKDAMMPLECVYMLDINRSMDDDTMTEVLSQSHSRIPIYKGCRENIVALLLVKTLIKLDPKDATPIQTLVDNGTARPVLNTIDEKPLFDLLNVFQEGKGHLAVVQQYQSHGVSLNMDRQCSELEDNLDTPLLHADRDDDDDEILDIRPKVIGIISLEDVLEELIQEEIIDETDVYVDIMRRVHVARAKAAKKTPALMRSANIQRNLSQSSHTRRSSNLNVNDPDLLTVADVYTDTDQLLHNQVMA